MPLRQLVGERHGLGLVIRFLGLINGLVHQLLQLEAIFEACHLVSGMEHVRREHAQRVLAEPGGALSVDKPLAGGKVGHRLEVTLPDLIHHVAADVGPAKDFLNLGHYARVHGLSHIAAGFHHADLNLAGRILVPQFARHAVALSNSLVFGEAENGTVDVPHRRKIPTEPAQREIRRLDAARFESNAHPRQPRLGRPSGFRGFCLVCTGGILFRVLPVDPGQTNVLDPLQGALVSVLCVLLRDLLRLPDIVEQYLIELLGLLAVGVSDVLEQLPALRWHSHEALAEMLVAGQRAGLFIDLRRVHPGNRRIVHQIREDLRLCLILAGKSKTRVFQPFLRNGVCLGVFRASERIHQAFDAEIIPHRRHIGPGQFAEIVQGDGFQERGLQIGQLTAQFLNDAGLRYSLDASGLALWSTLFSLIIWRACFR